MIGLAARPSAFRRGTIACTGIEFCKLAIVETKGRGRDDPVAGLEKRLPDFDTPITINVNGCPNSCARIPDRRHRLQGPVVVKARTGEQVEGFQVHLGGGLGMAQGQAAGFGRKFRGLKDHRRGTARLRRAGAPPLPRPAATEGESFANWVIRVDEEELR